MKLKINSLYKTEFDQDQLLARAALLQNRFSDETNAKKLVTEVFGLEVGNWWF